MYFVLMINSLKGKKLLTKKLVVFIMRRGPQIIFVFHKNMYVDDNFKFKIVRKSQG